jgi:Methionine synthase II (cobalamin-independent)
MHIRTTHVGSLVRPPELVEIMRAREHGEPVDPDRHTQVLTAAVADVVRRQADVGWTS